MSEIPSFPGQKNRVFLKFLEKPGSPEILGFSYFGQNRLAIYLMLYFGIALFGKGEC